MSSQFRFALIWLLGAAIMTVVTTQMTIASFVDGQYLPLGHDSFYHARRILDAVASGHLYQFDAMMHVPEGDWITWPWAYDLFLAKAVRLLVQFSHSTNAVSVLMHLPPVLGLIAAGVLLGVCVELRLSITVSTVAMICFSLHAFTQGQFGIGSVDHHGAEQIAALGALWLGLRWLHEPASLARAAAIGIWLGAAIGIHAGLFILQIPLLAAMLLAWRRGDEFPIAASKVFCAGLIGGTLAVLVPAETFWSTRFVVYYLSWMHLYVSSCTCVLVLLVSRQPFSKRRVKRLIVFCGLLAAPMFAVMAFSSGFLSGNLSMIKGIDEIQSPFAAAAQDYGLRRVSLIYTLLVWVAPLTLLVSMIMALREKDSARAYFWLGSAFGLGLLLLQLRLASFGVYYLYLPLLVLASNVVNEHPGWRARIWGTVAVLLVTAYYPTVRYQLFAERVPAMDQQYATLRPILPALRDACEADPGVVLAEPGDGHVIRYFTNCSVISNNFRITPMDVLKITQALDLIGLPIEDVRRYAPRVKYIVARLVPPKESSEPVLFRQLLSMTEARPPGVDVIVEMGVTHQDGTAEKYMGAYRIAPGTPGVTSDSGVSPRVDVPTQ